METATFAWPVTARTSGSTTYRTRSAQFGDGYGQAVKDGINNVADEWDVSVQGSQAALAPIRAFVDARGGAESFYWTPPLGRRGLYRANNIRTSGGSGDYYTLSMTFKQAFAP